MSDDGRNYVKKYSPYNGNTFLLHFALGDLAQEATANEITVSDEVLMQEWPFTKRTLERARSVLAEAGFITVLEDARRYRFEYPVTDQLRGRQNGGAIPPHTPLKEINSLEGVSKGGQVGGRQRKKPETPFPQGNFLITEAMRAWLVENHLDHLNIRLETERFRDHALSCDRRCRDWVAAWRNWMRKAGERNTNGSGVIPAGGIKPLRLDLTEQESLFGGGR